MDVNMRLTCLGVVAMLPAAEATPAIAVTNVVVFNFQMKSNTPDWAWLAKGLADRLAVDLSQDRGLSLVHRDEMNRLAEQMKWVPEMMRDVKQLGTIRRELRPEYLISGVYEIADKNLTITGIVVDFSTNKEAARRKVTGPMDQVIELMRRLSANLLSWLGSRPAQEILKTLPVWTRSIPATRALYEGVDLYDQGRYGEAWLKFRTASRADPAYVEAQYWVGKMYYFMDRYEHARRSLERFMYLDASHPRRGDAIKEYVHTFENLRATTDQVLDLYVEMGALHPRALIYDKSSITGMIRNERWLELKSAQLLAAQGRFKLAAKLTDRNEWGGQACWQAHHYLLVHYCLTGQLWTPDWLKDWDPWGKSLAVFSQGVSKVTLKAAPTSKKGWYEHAHTGQRFFFQPEGNSRACEYFLVAPSGKRFISLKVFPQLDDFAGDVKVLLSKDDTGDLAQVTVAAGRAGREGISVNKLPPVGLLQLQCEPPRGARITALRIEAKFADADAQGAIDVVCTNAAKFRVDIDGRHHRTFAGLIGPVSAGTHTLTVRPFQADSPYDTWTTTLAVKAGRTTRVVATLPWKKSNPWGSWNSGALVGQNYQGRFFALSASQECPSILAEDDAIHMVWSRGEDLWHSRSTDGTIFSPPQRLPMPLSSGWAERNPQLLRTESGRYMLVFLSDRNAMHTLRPYVSWSRDFVHWSAPAAVYSDGPMGKCHIIQDRQGWFFLVGLIRGKPTVFQSQDAFRWDRLATVSPRKGTQVSFMQLLGRSSRGVELFVGFTVYRQPDRMIIPVSTDLMRFTVGVLQADASLEKIGQIDWPGNKVVASMIVRDGVPTLACFSVQQWEAKRGRAFFWYDNQKIVGDRMDGHYLTKPKGYAPEAVRLTSSASEWSSRCGMWLFRKDGTRWRRVTVPPGLPQGFGTLAYHRRWGYLIGWMAPASSWVFPRPAYGPIVIRGPALYN